MRQEVIAVILLKPALRTLKKFDWVVYAKPPFGGPEHVLTLMEWAIRRQEPPGEGSEVGRRCP